MAENPKKTPWEAYSEQAIDPFGNSMLGQTLNQQREDRLRQQLDENEAQQFWQDLMEQGGTRQNEEIPNPDVTDMSIEDMVGGKKGKYMWAAPNILKQSGSLLSKVLPKQATKLGIKGGLRFVPGLGWAMAGADLIDYFGYPIYDHLPGGIGDYMTWRDTSEGEEE